MSIPSSTTPSRRRVTLVLITLFLGTFTLGTAELGVVGMINLISDDLQVSLDTTGTLVTAYAIGLAIGGPVLAAVTIRVPRRPLLITTMIAYVAVTAIVALSPSFGIMFAGRLIAGAVQGLFVGVAFTIGLAVAPSERAGQAASAVIGGFAVSVAFGVPLGALLGQAVGWRGSFLVMVALATACLVAILLVVPQVPSTGSGGLSAQLRYAFAPRVLAILLLAVLMFAGQYAAFTYITPFLIDVTGVPDPIVSAFLLAYGVATAIGVFAAGRFVARAAPSMLILTTVVVLLCLVGLAVVGGVAVAVAVLLFVWGIFGFGFVPAAQYRIVDLAGPGKDLAATLPASATNAGIAIGALAGGWAVANISVASVMTVGAVIVGVAVPLAWLTMYLKPPAAGALDAATTSDGDESVPATA